MGYDIRGTPESLTETPDFPLSLSLYPYLLKSFSIPFRREEKEFVTYRLVSR